MNVLTNSLLIGKNKPKYLLDILICMQMAHINHANNTLLLRAERLTKPLSVQSSPLIYLPRILLTFFLLQISPMRYSCFSLKCLRLSSSEFLSFGYMFSIY